MYPQLQQLTSNTKPTIVFGQCRIPVWAETEHFERGISRLPDHLHADIRRYHRLEDRLSRLVTRLLVQKILQIFGLWGESSLSGWRKTAWGRPFLKDSIVDISISHAGLWAVGAAGFNCRIGVDVEVFRPLDLTIFTPYFTTTEMARVQTAAQPVAEALNCWSLREAILKADGRGLSLPEAQIRDITGLLTPAGTAWRVRPLVFADGCLYLACDQEIDALDRYEFDFLELVNSEVLTA